MLYRDLSIWDKKLYSLSKKGLTKIYFEHSSKIFVIIFRLFYIFHRRYHQTKYHLSKQFSFFDLLSFLIYSRLSYFRLLVLFCTMGKEIGRFSENNRSKLSTPTLKKPVLSSSSSHTSSASNSTWTYISSRLNNKYITTNKNKNNVSNTDDIHSCVTPWNQNYSVQATSTSTNLKPLNDTLPILYVKLHTTTELPPSGKEYLSFHINSKSSHAAQCVKSRIMNKYIDSILSINTYELQCIVIKGMLKSPRLEYHMKTIGIDQSLVNRPSIEHKFLNNIKKIYQHAVKCDDQKNLKYIIDYAMVILHSKPLMSVLACV